jgi:iron complex transport system permease protein
VKKRWALLVLLSLLLLVGAALVGAPLEGERGSFIFWQLRVPRVLVGVLVGSTLAIAGAAFQTLFANPLATPSTIGTTAGATLGALLSLTLDLEGAASVPASVLAAFAGALIASLIVAAVSSSGRAAVSDVLLAGIAVTLATGALASGLTYIADSRALVASARWSLGQLPQVGYRGVAIIAPAAAICALLLLGASRALQSFALGEDLAHAHGVAVRRLRLWVLIAGSLGVAACVAWCGPIAFVGLLVPHLVRLVLGSSPARLLPGSLIAGGAFLVTCDVIARSIVPGRELPVGVVTAALGAPALIALIARNRSR